MDLNTISSFERPNTPEDLDQFRDGDAWIAGGTWLFSEPQPHLRRLISIDGFNWQPVVANAEGLTIAATCKIADLDAFEAPIAWQAGPLIKQCCRSFLASFKIWKMATIGGNLCMALPAGPMISLCASLDGMCEIWRRDGTVRYLPVMDFVHGPHSTALDSGDLLRAIFLPAQSLKCRAAFRRSALAPMGRTGVLVIGTASETGGISLTVTAATPRPVRLEFDRLPSSTELDDRLSEILPLQSYYDDVHGAPGWRQHMTREFCREILQDLRGPQV
ncbi:MAG: FAD binding domain-containing protein [Roseobacter sp.]